MPFWWVFWRVEELGKHNRDRAVVAADHLRNASVGVTELARPYYVLPLLGRQHDFGRSVTVIGGFWFF